MIEGGLFIKVVFLDIDGVLNDLETFKNCEKFLVETGNTLPEINEIFVKRLSEIINATGAVIVLSSSWKNGWNHDFDKCSNHCKELVLALKRYGMEIYEKTRDLKGKRQDEIEDWLSLHKETTSFVILDDETTFLMGFVGKGLVKTSTLPPGVMLKDIAESTGIQPEHVAEAIRILNQEERKNNMFGISDYVKMKTTGKEVLIVDEDELVYRVKERDGREFAVRKHEVTETEAEYCVPITWEMCGMVRTMARSAEEALMRVEKGIEKDSIEIPNDKEYVESSMEITDQNISHLHLYQKK